jgi:hypothetical protein
MNNSDAYRMTVAADLMRDIAPIGFSQVAWSELDRLEKARDDPGEPTPG